MELLRRAGEPQVEMIDIPPEPAAAHAEPVCGDGRYAAATRTVGEQSRKVHTSVDGQLQRAPEPAVHFHQNVMTCGDVPFAFDHRHALPLQQLEELPPRSEERGVWRDALAIDGSSACRRLLPQPAV